jgi:1-aminocyclopropane-1-carboxylate deaminase/D-cysteine desulfhydrase-like pyridoxal-dependent ACC family enzyme
MYSDETPVEAWRVGVRSIHVKRDDLFASPPAPPTAKLRGLRALLESFRTRGHRRVGCFEASRSSIGHALAAACAHFCDMECIVVYPDFESRPKSPSILAAEQLGAHVVPIRNNILAICQRQAAKLVEAANALMVPFGCDCPEAVAAVQKEAARLDPALVYGGTVVVPCGSGVTLAGILRGLPTRPHRVIGVSIGSSPRTILKRLARHGVSDVAGVELRAPEKLYHEAANVFCPFPCNEYYDIKAWKVAVGEVEKLREPILFWNIGG